MKSGCAVLLTQIDAVKFADGNQKSGRYINPHKKID